MRTAEPTSFFYFCLISLISLIYALDLVFSLFFFNTHLRSLSYLKMKPCCVTKFYFSVDDSAQTIITGFFCAIQNNQDTQKRGLAGSDHNPKEKQCWPVGRANLKVHCFKFLRKPSKPNLAASFILRASFKNAGARWQLTRTKALIARCTFH